MKWNNTTKVKVNLLSKGGNSVLEVIRNEYGKEYGNYEFDYIGDHPDLDIVLINAKVRLYEKGLYLWTTLDCGRLFVKWADVHQVIFKKSKEAEFSIFTDRGTITFKRERVDVCVDIFLTVLLKLIPKSAFKLIEVECENVTDITPQIKENMYEQQLIRIDDFLKAIVDKDDSEREEVWYKKLEEQVKFPFDAEFVDDEGEFEIGDRFKVVGLESCDGKYGIIAKVKKGRKQYLIPLCQVKPIDKEGVTFQLVDDYDIWFWNYRG